MPAKAASSTRPIWLSDARRIELAQLLVSLGLIAGQLLTPQLWQARSSLPNVPLAPWLASLLPLSTLLAALSALALVGAILFKRWRRPLLWAGLALLVLCCSLDLFRCQPWVWIYAWLLLLLSLPRVTDGPGQRAALNAARVAAAGVYIFSGVSKFTPAFATEVLPWMLRPLDGWHAGLSQTLVTPLALIVPIAELLFGLLLLIPALRWLGLVAALAMHVSILYLLGPFGNNWNSVVWPWNIAMALILLALFGGPAQWSTRELLLPRPARLSLPQYAALLIFMLLPVLALADRWPAYFSSALYCGNVTKGYLYVDAVDLARLPANAQAVAYSLPDGRAEISIYDWSFRELNCPSFPEAVVYLGVARALLRRPDPPQTLRLVLRQRLCVGQHEPTVVNYDRRLLR